jgi:hypothetical protein
MPACSSSKGLLCPGSFQEYEFPDFPWDLTQIGPNKAPKLPWMAHEALSPPRLER